MSLSDTFISTCLLVAGYYSLRLGSWVCRILILFRVSSSFHTSRIHGDTIISFWSSFVCRKVTVNGLNSILTLTALIDWLRRPTGQHPESHNVPNNNFKLFAMLSNTFMSTSMLVADYYSLRLGSWGCRLLILFHVSRTSSFHALRIRVDTLLSFNRHLQKKT